MILLISIVVCAAWAFYLALLIDRPDLAVLVVPAQYSVAVHVAFAVFLALVVYRFSHREISNSQSWFRNGPSIFLRNLVVFGLGIALLVFTCREVLNGVDPTGRRALFG